MTPPATTSDGRRSKDRETDRRRASPSGRSVASGHRRALTRRAAPRSPRRVSGPLSGRAAELIGRVARAAPRAAGRTAPRRSAETGPGRAAQSDPRSASQKPRGRAAQSDPRSASRTQRGRAAESASWRQRGRADESTTRTIPQRQRRRASQSRSSAAASISARGVAFLQGLPDHPLLDRIVRGRVWIALLGLMLAGIVAMQVEQLKLGASIGRSVERTSQLQTRNQQLQASIAALSDDQRIESLAARQGMIMPPPEAIDFLANPGQIGVQKALSNIHAPNPSAFSSLQTGSGEVVTSLNATGSASASLAGAPASGQASTVATAPLSTVATAPGTGATGQLAASGATAQTPTTSTGPSTGMTGQVPATSSTGPSTGTTAQTPATSAVAPSASTSGQTPAAPATVAAPATGSDQSPATSAISTATPSGG